MNAGILLIEPFGTKFSEISIEIHIFVFKKMHLKMSSGKWQPFCLSLSMLKHFEYRTQEHLTESVKFESDFLVRPGLGSSKVLVLGTWCKKNEYLVLTCTWHFEIQKYLVLTCTWRQSTWYLSKYFQVLLSVNKYSGLNLQICFLQQSPLTP